MSNLGSISRLAIGMAMLIGGATVTAWHGVPTTLPPMRVVKSPTCGCCAKWVEYMKEQGFRVSVEDRDQFTDLKRSSGVTAALESCHTAFVGGYVIEGHVPADLVKKLLADKPAGIKGLAAPGMPASAPGMDMAGSHYTIYSFDGHGQSKVYAQR